MSATLFNRSQFNTRHFGFTPLGGVSPNYPVQQVILFITTSITLTWTNPPLANLFQIQVSLTPDFTGSDIQNDATLNVNTKTFTDSGTNGAKRYWRWRWSADSGTTWGRWSHVNSYWLDTTAAQAVTVTRNTWMLINTSPTTDRYTFEIFPMYRETPQNLYRVRNRNRLGTLLSEYITNKGMVDMNFDEQRWMNSEEIAELRRFGTAVRTFYLATMHDHTLGFPVARIWKAQFVGDPEMGMFNAGRQDMFTGTLSFEEV